MPTGPKGQKRPADVVANAILVGKIATGEATETVPDDGKDKAAQALGKKGGAAPAVEPVAGPTISRYQSAAEFGVRVAQHLSKLEALETESHLWPPGGCGPTSDALSMARGVLLRLASNDSSMIPDKIVATLDAGVAICFVNGDRYSDIECLGDGGILGVATDRRGGPSVWEIDPSLSGIDSAAIRIRKFIRANSAAE